MRLSNIDWEVVIAWAFIFSFLCAIWALIGYGIAQL
jgi:hypothetical protein